MDISTSTLAVGLNTLARHGATAWGLSSNEGHALGGVVPAEAASAQAFLAGFEALLAEPSMNVRAVDLYCAHEELSRLLTDMSASFPLMQVVPYTATTPVGVLARAARKAAAAALDLAGHGVITAGPSTDVDTASREYAATDGSVGFRRGQNLSGWGWLTSSGRYDNGTHPGGDVLSAELVAVHRLLKSTPPSRPLTVLVDSQAALAVIEGLRSPADLRVPVPAGHDMKRIMGRIADRCAHRDVTFEWVRGHSGHPLNDGADRLAVQARRGAQCGVAPQTGREMAQRIAQETVTAFHHFAPCAA